jgi:glycosyltransferase involved in cell wall biosynthesis
MSSTIPTTPASVLNRLRASVSGRAAVRTAKAVKTRLTMVQYGDYAEAYHRFAAGGAETYYAQRYTVGHMSQLARSPHIEDVTIIHVDGVRAAERLDNGITSIGMKLYEGDKPARFDELVALVAARQPTHLVVASPIIPLLKWGLDRKLRVLPLLADSFRQSGTKAFLKAQLLALTLGAPAIELVANHSIAAALDLVRIGVPADKVAPFDWPAVISPHAKPAKQAPSPTRRWRILYVGMLMETKGVGDVIRAVRLLRDRDIACSLTLIGGGETDRFRRLTEELNLADNVEFAGRRPHDVVMQEMHDHDVLVVPSRHEYPEGLPMTLYEGLCSRTPLVVSDHPMFALRMRDGVNCVVFPERDAAALAAAIVRLRDDRQLYEQLSRDAEKHAEEYLCPLKWDRLITAFVDDELHTLRAFTLAEYGPLAKGAA